MARKPQPGSREPLKQADFPATPVRHDSDAKSVKIAPLPPSQGNPDRSPRQPSRSSNFGDGGIT